jgi:L-alanine-DL-glutamate epimerase-like enolase superfamily enzyme
VVVKVATDEGITGWGEAHHGRAHTAVAKLIETTLKQLILGMDALATTVIWEKLYRAQLASHGMGAGACLAISGIDMALWDIRGKALKLPLYRLLGGASKPIPAYAGGVSLGYQPEAELVAEARKSLDQGYKAIKLRLGDSPSRDIARMRAVRKAFGDDSSFSPTPTSAISSRTCAASCRCSTRSAQAGWRSRSRRTTTAATAKRSSSAAPRSPPGRTITPASSSTA